MSRKPLFSHRVVTTFSEIATSTGTALQTRAAIRNGRIYEKGTGKTLVRLMRERYSANVYSEVVALSVVTENDAVTKYVGNLTTHASLCRRPCFGVRTLFQIFVAIIFFPYSPNKS